ncbi:MAG TPA: GAF domain-containing protein [Prolixibacteraceae bacterium]|nr:GAF domain-containing protein [Prolixibacteraceae bacterium]
MDVSKILAAFRSNRNEMIRLDEILQRTCLLLRQEVDHYHWVGFYIWNPESRMLELGPYEGSPTEHTRIAPGRGACGLVADTKKTLVLQDVATMDNYLSCNIDVRSEIVVPILKEGEFVAELDVDSHTPSPFTDNDRVLLETICRELAVFF